MFTKLLLIIMLLSTEFVQTTTRRPEDFIGVVIAGAAAGYGISYWCTRESNGDKQQRALGLCKTYEEKLHAALVSIKEPQDAVDFVSQPLSLHDEQNKFALAVAQSVQEIGNRYAHPFKPWNWSDDMKEVFNRILCVHAVTQTITIMYRYQSLLKILVEDVKPSIKQENIVDAVLDTCSGKITYPLIVHADRIQQDIEALTAGRDISSVPNGSCAYVVIGMLRGIRASIVESDEYLEEIKCQKKMGLQQVQAITLEAQAIAKKARNKAQRQYNEEQVKLTVKEIQKQCEEMQQRKKAKEQELASFAAQMLFANEPASINDNASQNT